MGLVKSLLAALVPTAILIAETFLFSGTLLEMYACDEVIAKFDKD